MKTTLSVTTPANAESIGRGENLVWDAALPKGGWSTRIGYETYFPDFVDAGWAPFQNLGRIDSLYVWNRSPGLHYVFFESGGVLYVLHEWGGTPAIVALASGRHIPTLIDSASTYIPVPSGLLVVNGVDTPILIQPWPLGTASETSSSASQVVRPFGVVQAPPAIPMSVAPIVATSGAPASTANVRSGDTVSIWWASRPAILGYPGLAGIGYATTASDPEDVSYTYKVSYVTDLGAESPISPPAVLTWRAKANQTLGTRHVPAIRIPLGPEGTVARKLYRSGNWANDGTAEGDDTVYLSLIIPNNVDEVVFDYTLPAALGAQEPVLGFSIPLPAPRARFAEVYQGRLILAGDPSDPYTVHISTATSIEQFALGESITLPQDGGQITGIKAHYTMLLVFRERSLDVIDSSLTATTLLSGVECIATHSACSTPYGLVFAAREGIYLVQGGIVGGATVKVQKLSDHPTISDIWVRQVSPSGPLLARACATWNSQRHEYWLQVPPNGEDRPSLGVVWHPNVPSATGLGCFTLRKGFPAGCFATMPNGETIFGHYEGNPDATQGEDTPAGLFVVSAKRALGITGPVADEYSYAEAPTSIFRSPWIDFGDTKVLKVIDYVTLDSVATGDVQLTPEFGTNGLGPWVSENTYYSQPPATGLVPVWASDADDLRGTDLPYDNPMLDEYSSEQGVLAPIRFSVGQKRGVSFAWQIATQSDFLLMGYTLEGTTAEMKPVPGVKV